MQKFEKGFFIGAATAAHQVEGNNINSDYWAQEQLPHSSFTEPSGIACDHYHRYEEDIKLLADAGLNAYRFSIEWARVEPEEGKFDPEAVEHYRKVIACCKAHGAEPIVTLLHFTSPKWLICKGGWEAESTVEDFKNYVVYVMEQLGSELRYVCTINEANMGLQLATISKRFRLMAEQAAQNAASAGKSAEGTVQVGMNFQKMMENMKFAAMENAQVFGTPQPQIFVSERTPEGNLLVRRAHAAARDAIKAICPRQGGPDPLTTRLAGTARRRSFCPGRMAGGVHPLSALHQRGRLPGCAELYPHPLWPAGAAVGIGGRRTDPDGV